MILLDFSLRDFFKRALRGIPFYVLMVFLTSVFGQESVQERALYMSQLGIKDGLSSGGINSIAEDSKGYLWFGTTDGLNRFDGYRVKKYVNQSGNVNSLISSYVNKIYFDSRGWLWILTRSNGLHLYNSRNDNFLRIPWDGRLIDLLEDQNGDIWCQTDKGYDIIQINPEYNEDLSFPADEADIAIKASKEVYPNLPEFFLNGNITLAGSSGLWVHKSDTLYNFNLAREREDAPRAFKIGTGQTKDKDLQLLHNTVKNQMIVSGETELLIFDIATRKFVDSIDMPLEIINSKVLQLIDHKNRLWLLADGVFCRVDLNTKIWEKISLQREGFRKNQLKYAVNAIEDSHNNCLLYTSPSPRD